LKRRIIEEGKNTINAHIYLSLSLPLPLQSHPKKQIKARKRCKRRRTTDEVNK
jgi:hypothetical protein